MEVNKSVGRIWKRHEIWKPTDSTGSGGQDPLSHGIRGSDPLEEVGGRRNRGRDRLLSLKYVPANSSNIRVRLKLLIIDNGFVSNASVIGSD